MRAGGVILATMMSFYVSVSVQRPAESNFFEKKKVKENKT